MSRALTGPPRRIADADGFAIGGWRAILDRLEDPHPFLSADWQRAWWSHFGRGRLAVLELGVDAVAAVEIDALGTARFLGCEATTDYPGPAIAPAAADAAAAALLRALAGHGARPRELDARNLRDVDGFAGALVRAAADVGLRVSVGDDEPVAVLELPDAVHAWRGSLTRHARHELARKQRRWRRDQPGGRVRTSTAATLDADLDAFCALHRCARGVKARFLTPALESFVREIAWATARESTLRLDTLEDGEGRPLAMTLGFQGPRTYYLYNMAFAPDAAALSPGIVLVASLVERAIADGHDRVDLLRGLERYKLELGATPTTLRRVRVQLR